MSGDSSGQISTVSKKYVTVAKTKWGTMNFVALARHMLLCAIILMLQPSGCQAVEASPQEVMSLLRTRLNLSEDQEEKIKAIVEESSQKRSDIVKHNSQDRKTMRSQLQELQWATDIRIGEILTEEQLKEYQKLREDQKEKVENTDAAPQGRKSRHGRGDSS
ncbi:MAG TPA: hypothetical protein VEI46_00715 [Thermodesulfovibrionales bacterium]|nr:hypothetical protein [Thermodesulfovibrionales bacterium]